MRVVSFYIAGLCYSKELAVLTASWCVPLASWVWTSASFQVKESTEREKERGCLVYHKYWRYEWNSDVGGRSELGCFHCLCPAQGVQWASSCLIYVHRTCTSSWMRKTNKIECYSKPAQCTHICLSACRDAQSILPFFMYSGGDWFASKIESCLISFPGFAFSRAPECTSKIDAFSAVPCSHTVGLCKRSTSCTMNKQ